MRTVDHREEVIHDMTPELEFLLSFAGLILAAILAYVAFTRTRWATH